MGLPLKENKLLYYSGPLSILKGALRTAKYYTGIINTSLSFGSELFAMTKNLPLMERLNISCHSECPLRGFILVKITTNHTTSTLV